MHFSVPVNTQGRNISKQFTNILKCHLQNKQTKKDTLAECPYFRITKQNIHIIFGIQDTQTVSILMYRDYIYSYT